MMTRNESNLEFQKRLMKVARRAPKYEALKMMSIVYDNLIEFAQVRIPMDPNPSSIMEKYVDTLEYFMYTLQAKFTNFFLQNDLNMMDDMIPIITTKIKEYANSHNTTLAKGMTEVYNTAYSNEYGFMHMGTYVHPIIMQRCYWKVKDALGLGKEALPVNVPGKKLNMTILGDRKKIVAPPHYFGSNLMAMVNVSKWLDERTNDSAASSGITITFAPASSDEIRDYSGTVYLDHIRYDNRQKYFMKSVDTSSGSFDTMDREFHYSQQYAIYTNNVLLINFSSVAKMILHNTGNSLAEELSYHESSEWIKQMHGIIWKNENCKGDEMDIIYRTPGDEHVLWKVFEAIGLPKNLCNKILEVDQLNDLREMVHAWKAKPSITALDAISDSYMTFYRSGPIINYFQDEGSNVTIVDLNVRFAVIMALYLGKRAHFFIEIRARDSERLNLQLVEILLNCGADVHVVSKDLYDKKVHAKFWLFARGLTQSDVLVTSTGNFTTDSQTHFADTYHICNTVKYMSPSTTYHTDVMSAMTVLMSTVKAKHMSGNMESSLIWKPKQIKEYLLYKINELAELKRRNPHLKPVIWIKCNHLTDSDICKALTYAGYYGVNAKLIVRTTCLFSSPDRDDNYIKIYSVAGKYLEHDRYYIFDDGMGKYEGGISSADLMHRNLSERIEFLEKLSSEQCQALVERVIIPMISNGSSPKEGFYVFYLNK